MENHNSECLTLQGKFSLIYHSITRQNHELEKDILSLTNEERQTLIEKINQEIGGN